MQTPSPGASAGASVSAKGRKGAQRGAGGVGPMSTAERPHSAVLPLT
eukprot:CAMPEP_0119539656 /NCGR_PEP_ID=MMETSP1344-20130328/51744_1 /TAXON_ID=236787 /ORGANISM="Florenciella parvula, Strain CCMP2471" /LENGTH=46 /DNA_ID= /DNA_START= /DNA_END= /DNA_ORIENTATION=